MHMQRNILKIYTFDISYFVTHSHGTSYQKPWQRVKKDGVRVKKSRHEVKKHGVRVFEVAARVFKSRYELFKPWHELKSRGTSCFTGTSGYDWHEC